MTCLIFSGKRGGRGRLIGRTKGGMNTKLHAVCDSQGRPISLFVTAGQVSDYIGGRALLNSLPDVDWLLGDRGYDADWFREALEAKGIRACIPGRKQRKTSVKYDKPRYNAATASRSCSAGARTGDVSHSLWRVSEGLSVRHRARRDCNLLVMSPEPN